MVIMGWVNLGTDFCRLTLACLFQLGRVVDLLIGFANPCHAIWIAEPLYVLRIPSLVVCVVSRQ
jgi:hypothetical protein